MMLRCEADLEVYVTVEFAKFSYSMDLKAKKKQK